MVAHSDQKSGKLNGIVCDLCGGVYTNQFIYYSAQFDLIEVDVSLGKVQRAGRDMLGIQNVDFKNLSLDVCNKCMGELIHKVKAQILARSDKKPTQGGGAWTTKT
jgi:hypothetical protein